ncbi:MAG: Two-component transcriptional response regulator, LuxR family [uncultured Chloroflexia bacterium]|uniref:Two-component transcriptional response regulator, LuxR family n=1 Tax=uncultured Chloroflexia bacterium TaxID=1672391 RepID=A0A6J4IAK9_9CHLR|nr:MAG: Two-component transcriptional response regulator, LuxR family [uncultured Chloroflexia bacterium]
MEPIKVLIADDHPMFREGVRSMLRREDSVTLVGEATTGSAAITLAAELQPDVILMDVHMPEVNGIDATRRILQQHPHMRVLVLTMFEDDDSVFAALRAGARGYLLKGADKAEIVRAISGVASGEAIFGPAIAQRLIAFFSAPQAPAPPPVLPELTDREREILGLMTHGLSNQDIADRLVVSLKTVRNNVSNIFSKLEVVDRAQAVLRARDAGLS